MMRRPLSRAALLCLLGVGMIVLSTCSAGGGGRLQDAAADFVIDYRFSDLPPGCPPNASNDKGIGGSCTRGGGQCSGNKICTCDTTLGVTPPPGTPCFCTIAILQSCASLPAGTCGQNATCCSYQNQAAICVPDVCLDSAACPVF